MYYQGFLYILVKHFFCKMSTYPRNDFGCFEALRCSVRYNTLRKDMVHPGMRQYLSLPFLKNVLRTGQN